MNELMGAMKAEVWEGGVTDDAWAMRTEVMNVAGDELGFEYGEASAVDDDIAEAEVNVVI